MITEMHPCKRCGGERFEVAVKNHYEFVIEDAPDAAKIEPLGGTVGDVTCSTCGRLAMTPYQLTEEEKEFLLERKEVTA